MNSFKQQLITSCENYFTQKVVELTNALRDVTDAGNNETKSTAGDKHETARAMMQLEQEKLGKQLFETEEQYASLQKIDFNKPSDFISIGTLVETNRGLFFIASAIGKVVVEDKIVFVISHLSPLGKLLLGKKQKDTVVFNSVSYEIDLIY